MVLYWLPKLNVRKMNLYLPSQIGDIFNTLSGAQWLSSLDLNSGYWQLWKHKKTALFIPNELFQFNVILFEHCNVPPWKINESDPARSYMENLVWELGWHFYLAKQLSNIYTTWKKIWSHYMKHDWSWVQRNILCFRRETFGSCRLSKRMSMESNKVDLVKNTHFQKLSMMFELLGGT